MSATLCWVSRGVMECSGMRRRRWPHTECTEHPLGGCTGGGQHRAGCSCQMGAESGQRWLAVPGRRHLCPLQPSRCEGRSRGQLQEAGLRLKEGASHSRGDVNPERTLAPSCVALWPFFRSDPVWGTPSCSAWCEVADESSKDTWEPSGALCVATAGAVYIRNHWSIKSWEQARPP